jgi:rhodanese-related sulfurtransferase
MKWYILFGILILSFSYSCKNASAEEVNVVTVAEMENHLKYGKVQVVDVQNSRDFKKSHLMNARNIVFDEDFRNNLEDLDKSQPVAIYCTTGETSAKAAGILKEMGFKNIYLLDGGIKKWEDQNKDLNRLK